MSLIDKTKTVEAIATYLFINDAIRSAEPMKIRDYLVFAESILKDVPDLNVVRCKECTHRKKNGFCLEHNRYEKNDNGYCSYGERKE
ncbi:MAG: hypothetical protein IIY21_05395 [Clostridiales bacterium]|nr:hypothetical protein [Clostridiales bacterium]